MREYKESRLANIYQKMKKDNEMRKTEEIISQ